MPFDDLRDRLPPYADDIAANLVALAQEDELNAQQKWGAFLASAYAVGQPEVIASVEKQADLGKAARQAVKAAAAIEAMNNVYYRAVNTISNADYRTLPPKLRMQALARPTVDRLDWELWSLAVSAINGCALCMDSHESELRKNAVSATRVQAVLRIAAVVHAASRVLAVEAAGERRAGEGGAEGGVSQESDANG